MTTINTEFKVTESFGTADKIASLTSQAINIARATGSVGATCEESNWNPNGDDEVIASVTVSRI